MSGYVHGASRARIAGKTWDTLELDHPAVARRRAHTEGKCGRGCCWTPFQVCAVERMCNCHHAPAAEVTEYLEYDEALDNVHVIDFTTSTGDADWREAA